MRQPLLILALAVQPCLAQTTLEMRAREPAPLARVEGFSLAGVHLAGEQPEQKNASYVIAWDRVASVKGELASKAQQFEDLAEQSWRARIRLERGDLAGAEPLLDATFTRTAGVEGPTPGMIASGLLRCRLERGAQTAAFAAYSAWLASGQSEAMFTLVNAETRLDRVIDPRTMLAMRLPPVWVDTPSLRAAIAADVPSSAANSRGIGITAIYRASMLRAAGIDAPLPLRPRPTEENTGEVFVWDIVASADADTAVRKDARARLQALTGNEDIAGWAESWCRFAIGRSLLLEADRELQLRGIVQLMHVPARWPQEQAYLSGVALALASNFSENNLADKAIARQLRNQLSSSSPNHPAVDGAIVPPPASTTQPPRQGGP